jgi:hypothetical protein
VSHSLLHDVVMEECMQVVAGVGGEVPPDEPVPSRAVTSDQPVSVLSVCEDVAEQTRPGSSALPESRESVHRLGGPHGLPASGPPDVGEQTMPGQPPERTSGEVTVPVPAGATDLPVRAPSDVGATALPGQAPNHTSGASRGTRTRRSRPSAGGAHGASSPRDRLPKRVLIMFSGPLGRPDGLAAELCKLGFEVVEIDKLAGGDQHDIRCDATFARLRAEIRSGGFAAVFLGIPCSTYSVARILIEGIADDGPPQVRDIWHIHGFPWLDAGWAREVRAANTVTARAVTLAADATFAGASVIIENPVCRGEGSPAYSPKYHDHGSLWDVPCVQRWRAMAGAKSVDCAQCAFEGEFQKLTTFLYSPDLHAAMSPLRTAVCTHGVERHASVAHGVTSEGEFVTARAAAYPAPLNRALAYAIAFPHAACITCEHVPGDHRPVVAAASAPPADPFVGPVHMRAGASRPHALAGEEVVAPPVGPPPSANPRRLEPELHSVLRLEGLPVVNVPPVTEWSEAPPPLPSAPPGPFTTHQLIPGPMQDRLREFRIAVHACMEAARRGRWRWARDHRPPPLHAIESECLLPAARGYVWHQSPEDGLWYPLEPSSWPHSPPDGELEIGTIISEALAMGFTDMEIISFMAHGYPGPELQREAVLGPPHVGALKNAAAFEKCAAKDRAHGWVRWGGSLPQVWPMRADPMNIVLRHGKARMTIDKTMELIAGLASYNQLVDLSSQPVIEYVKVSQLGRATAILLTAGIEVKLWGFDLEAYFRKTGKQRSAWWMSGFVHGDGYGYDPRIQFGQREAPVLCGRQSCFIMAAISRELRRLEALYPPRDECVITWLQARASLASASPEAERHAFTQLFFSM